MSFSLEWNGFKIVYSGDTQPNKWMIEYAKNADVVRSRLGRLCDLAKEEPR